MMKSPVFWSMFLFICSFSTTAFHAQPDLERITSLLDSTMQAEDIPAVSLGIIYQGETYFVNQGVLARTSTAQVDEQSIYQIASLGKPLIGIVANELMLQGVIRPDQAITTLLQPRFSKKRWVKLTQITIRHLLHHSSGLPQDANTAYRRKDGEAYQYNYSESDFYTDLAKVRIKSIDTYRYSNFGFALLAHLMEVATGSSYEELLQTYVLQPLKMQSTMISPSLDHAENLTTPYRKDDRQVATSYWEMGKMAGPSALYSTTADLILLLQRQIEVYRNFAEDNTINRWVLCPNRRF